MTTLSSFLTRSRSTMIRVTVLLRRARLSCMFISIMAIVMNFAAGSKIIPVTSYRYALYIVVSFSTTLLH